MVTTLPPNAVELAELWIANMEGRRHPVIRSGDRAPIPSWVRWAVWERDARSCRGCSWSDLPIHLFELDHIVPWSAGGSDRGDNLRVLCENCNQDRSNLVGTLDTDRRQRVAWVCLDCMDDYRGHKVIADLHPDPADAVLAFCARCGVVTTCPQELTW